MLAALLLALVGGAALFLFGRALATEAATDGKLVQRLIELAVEDQAAARRLLLEHPELLAARYLHDETPLHFCAVEGHLQGVRFLAEAGVPVDAVNAFGDTALIDAAALGNLGVVRALLRLGANPNVASPTRGPALHAAVERGEGGVVAALLDAGARADYVTDRGETVWAAVPKATPKRDEILRVLESHGAKP